tara:strand:+ start:149 stop:352 length:204 start_codon:yes stop_codon:yes gene_type:complete
MIRAAIWYLLQFKELWTDDKFIRALKKLFESNNPQKITRTKDSYLNAGINLRNISEELLTKIKKSRS